MKLTYPGISKASYFSFGYYFMIINLTIIVLMI